MGEPSNEYGFDDMLFPMIQPWENTTGNDDMLFSMIQPWENTTGNDDDSDSCIGFDRDDDASFHEVLFSSNDTPSTTVPAEVELPVSQINHNHLLPDKGTSRKYNRWSKEEHMKFLIGLRQHGKGSWINISNIIQTKTPTQVASHAQKYFLRHAHKGKRKSIHDMVLPDNSPVPHQIYQQIGVSFPNLNGPLSHHIDQQNEVPFSYLNGHVPHHIDHQNLVASSNIDLQHLHEMHPLIPQHINMQNQADFSSLARQQL